MLKHQMSSKSFEMGLVLVIAVVLWGGAKAQSGCTSALMGLTPCLNYVSGNSSSPSSSCCSQLGGVVKSQPQCLCSLLNGGGSSLGVTINQTLALALPGACNMQTPPVSQCNAGANGPTTSEAPPAKTPTSSPADSSKETPATPPKPSNTPSGTSSKTVPGTSGSTSDGNIDNRPLYLTFICLLIATCASNVFLTF